ncbi:hypothetical protein [Bacillus sp. M6-12]|nr:hypothetical protein [Bacillus sp. M6-12]
MTLEICTYEMPFETEDSFRVKIEAGKLKKEEECPDNNWIPDSYFEEAV